MSKPSISILVSKLCHFEEAFYYPVRNNDMIMKRHGGKAQSYMWYFAFNQGVGRMFGDFCNEYLQVESQKELQDRAGPE